MLAASYLRTKGGLTQLAYVATCGNPNVVCNAMNPLPDKDIIKFLKDNIQPLDDNAYGLGYRASVTLKDSTFLPCVIFRNPATLINLAIRRFKEEQSGKSIFAKSSGLGYREIVKTFVAMRLCRSCEQRGG